MRRLRFRELMSSLSISQLLALRETEAQLKPALAKKKKKKQLAGGSELSRNRCGFVVSGTAVSRLSVKVIKYCFLCHLPLLSCVGFIPQKSLPRHTQSSLGYTSFRSAMPEERGPLSEFPTDVLRLTSPAPDGSLWPGSYELSSQHG